MRIMFLVCFVFDRNRTIVLCPSCGNNEMQLMPISDYESYKLDNDYINEMVSELWIIKVVIESGEYRSWRRRL